MSDSETTTATPARCGYRQRLEQVSHYYLAPPTDDTVLGNDVFLLPVLLDEQDTEFPLHAFTLALAARNQAATIIRSDDKLVSVHSGSDITIYLLAVTDPSHRLFLKCRRVLMTVPASAEGVRRGCLHLKHLVNINKQISTGIIMTHVTDQSRVRGYYDGLATGAQTFLNHHPVSLGSLLERGTRHSDDPQTDAIPVGLASVADRIISQWVQPVTNSVSTTSTMTPGRMAVSGD